MVIFLIIYLVGAIIAYFAMREGLRGVFEEKHTIGQRNICLAYSPLSWISAFVGLVLIMASYKENDKSAKW